MGIISNYHIIDTKNYGRVLINLEELSRFGNAYFVMSKKHGKTLSGIVDSSLKEIVPLEKMELVETFINPEETDACFGFKYPDSEYLEYYHVKSYDNKTKLVLKTSRHDSDPLKISPVYDIPKYWVFIKTTFPNEYAIYNYETTQFKTIFFDELTFLSDEEKINNHAIYYSFDIVNRFEDKEEIFTSLCGFLDEECNFSSQILDTEHESFYEEIYFKNTLSKRFGLLIADLYRQAKEEHDFKEDKLIGLRSYLYNSFSANNEEKEKKDEPAKILEFKKRI